MNEGAVSEPSWVVGMIGARMNYAVQRAIHRRGSLRRFYTDVWFPRGLRRCGALGPAYGRLANRSHPKLHGADVVSFNVRMLAQELSFRVGTRQRWSRLPWFWRAQGELFGRLALEHLAKRPTDLSGAAFLGFNTTSLELHRYFRSHGAPAFHFEIGTGRFYERIWREEEARWPGWEAEPRYDLAPVHDRGDEEWHSATAVLAVSRFASDVIAGQGVDPARIGVVPLIVDPPSAPVDRSDRTGPLRVLFLGRASLMKGLPDFLEAIRAVGSRVVARIVGPIHVSDRARSFAPPSTEWLGAVPYRSVGEHFAWADAYVFPTMCDSFGVSQLEAMAYGLPVISTQHCGDVVEEGISGFRVPIRDPLAIAERLLRLHDDRELLARMSAAATARSGNFGPDRHYDALVAEAGRLRRSAHE